MPSSPPVLVETPPAPVELSNNDLMMAAIRQLTEQIADMKTEHKAEMDALRNGSSGSQSAPARTENEVRSEMHGAVGQSRQVGPSHKQEREREREEHV